MDDQLNITIAEKIADNHPIQPQLGLRGMATFAGGKFLRPPPWECSHGKARIRQPDRMFENILKRFRSATATGPTPLAELNLLRPAADRSSVCHAPFKSIRFEQNGVVRTCCFNRQVVLGKYPHQTLSEIWHSEEAEKIRAKVRDNDLSHGCQLCSRQLMNREFSTIKTRDFDGMPSNENGFPVMLDFSMHNTCNLECVMCNGEFSSSIRKNREKLPPLKMMYDAEFVTQLDEFIPRAHQMVFAGGEPFLIDLYLDIWERINVLNPLASVHIVTNGTILNARAKGILENGKYSITHSIESFERESYEIIRQNASYDRMMENMGYFMEYCRRKETTYSINLCPLQQNWEEIPEFVRFCNTKGIRLYILTVIYPPDSTLMTLSSERLTEIIERYRSVSFDPITPLQTENFSGFLDLIKRLEDWKLKAVSMSGIDERSRLEVSEDQDGKSVAFSDLLIGLRKKMNEHVEEHPDDHGLELSEIELKFNSLHRAFGHRSVPLSKIENLETLSPSMVVSLLKSYSDGELQQAVRDHFL